MTEDDSDLSTRLAGLAPAARPRDVSEVREAIRRTFDAITKARKRGVAWQQIAEAVAADGVKASDGTVPTEHEIRTLFHAERYARGGKRQRRRKGEAPAVTPPVPPRGKAPPVPTLPMEEAEDAAPALTMFRSASLKGKA